MAVSALPSTSANSGPATPHPEYMRGSERWVRVRACHDGTDAVKAAGKKFLPQPLGMTLPDYEKYLLRANFLPAVKRTEEVLSGLLLREPPDVKAPSDAKDLLADVTLTKQNLTGFAQDVVSELLVTGRVAVVLDFVAPIGAPVRPYWCLKHAEDLLAWRVEMFNDGPERLTRLVFRENTWVEDPNNEYGLVLEHRVREYTLMEEGVVVRVLALRDGKWIEIKKNTPSVVGQSLREIPSIIANSRQMGIEVIQPPLAPIADLSLSHYRTSADLEQGNYYASLPTAYTIGASLPAGPSSRGISTNQGQTHGIQALPHGVKGYRLGSGSVLELPKEAEIGYLEIKGPGLKSIHMTLDRKERNLQAVGARLVQDQKKQPETARAVGIKAQADASLLRLIANVTDEVLTQALTVSLGWMGDPTANVSVNLNRKYLDEEPKEERDPLDPSTLGHLGDGGRSVFTGGDRGGCGVGAGVCVPSLVAFYGDFVVWCVWSLCVDMGAIRQ